MDIEYRISLFIVRVNIKYIRSSWVKIEFKNRIKFNATPGPTFLSGAELAKEIDLAD